MLNQDLYRQTTGTVWLSLSRLSLWSVMSQQFLNHLFILVAEWSAVTQNRLLCQHEKIRVVPKNNNNKPCAWLYTWWSIWILEIFFNKKESKEEQHKRSEDPSMVRSGPVWGVTGQAAKQLSSFCKTKIKQDHAPDYCVWMHVNNDPSHIPLKEWMPCKSLLYSMPMCTCGVKNN